MHLSNRELEALIESHRTRIHAFFHKKGFSPPDTEDLFQDVVTALLESLPRFRGEASLSTWIYALCNNVYRSRIRRLEQDRKLTRDLEHKLGHTALPSPWQEETRNLDLPAFALGLSTTDRNIFEGFYLQGQTIRTLSHTLGMPEGTVKYRLYCLRQKLRQQVLA